MHFINKMFKSQTSEITLEPNYTQEAHKSVTKNVLDKTMDLDDVLANELGQFGRFQLRTLLFLLIPIIMSEFSGEYVFSAAAIPHRCRIPECEGDGYEAIFRPEWISNAIPKTRTGFSSCQRFSPFVANASLDHCPADAFNTDVVTTCKSYIYERNDSLAYDFDLGCRDWLRALAGTLNSLGTLLALPITGYFSDRYGRRLALVVNTFNVALFGFIRGFSTNYSMYLVFQFLQTTFGGSTFSTAFIFGTELVGPEYRALIGAILPSMLAVGSIVLGGVAWAVESWRLMILVLHTPCFLIVSYYWFFGESVRWLLSKQKYTEAKAILEKVAKVNGTTISDKSMKALLHPATKARTSDSAGLVKYIIRSPILLRRVCTTPFLWIATLFVFYGLFINSTYLSDALYLNFILTSVVDIPGYTAGFVLMNRIGRKITLGAGFLFSSACNIVFAFLPDDLEVLRLIIYLLSKFGIAMVLSGIYLYTSELYPTEHRHSLLAFSSMIGRIGSISAPLTPLLMVYWRGLPNAMFAVVGLLAGLLVFTQPETLGTKLPDTLAEAEALGKQETKSNNRTSVSNANP